MQKVIALTVALAMNACGGGRGSPASATPTPPPSPPCCASTAIIAGDFDSNEQAEANAFDTRRQAIQNNHAAAGTYFSGAFLGDLRDNGITYANSWAAEAFAAVDDAAATMPLDGPAIAEMVEDYRTIVIDYAVSDYDQVTSPGGWPPTAVAQARQDMIDGMNAVFDQLLADLSAAGYI